MNEGEVGGGELVVSGGEMAVFFQTPDQPLDDVALAIDAPVHEPWPGLGSELRDDGGDAATAEVLADRAAGVATIGEQSLWSTARAAGARSPDRTRLHQGLERGLLVALAGRQDEGDGSPVPLAAHMELRAEAAPRAAERLALLPPLAPAAWRWARMLVPSII